MAHGHESTDAAFVAFYDDHYTDLRRALSATVGDEDLGADAADEAMARAYQRWSRISRYENPVGWAYRVGLNWSRSRLRRRARARELAGQRTVGPTSDDPVRDLDLADALATLDHKHRAVVVCRYVLDWSTEDTAAALRTRPGTIKSRLHRALAQLEDRLATTHDPEMTR